MESRGNEKYGNEVQIGAEEACSTLHFGPRWDHDAFRTASYSRHDAAGYDSDFHKYEFIWDENGIKFFFDGSEVGFAAVGDGFWQRGRFSGQNIWENGTKMAPFDQEVWVIFQMLKLCISFFGSNCLEHSYLFSVSFPYKLGCGWKQWIFS